jgi:hypothetical protein
MGGHRKTIRRKKPLTFVETRGVKRRDAIRRLHTEMKSLDSAKEAAIPLAIYQNASSRGQTAQRGGDSSKVLVRWLPEEDVGNLRVLEVGCLEVDNAVAKYVDSHDGAIRRIDLKSRDPRIEEQDFMTFEPDEVIHLACDNTRNST